MQKALITLKRRNYKNSCLVFHLLCLSQMCLKWSQGQSCRWEQVDGILETLAHTRSYHRFLFLSMSWALSTHPSPQPLHGEPHVSSLPRGACLLLCGTGPAPLPRHPACHPWETTPQPHTLKHQEIYVQICCKVRASRPPLTNLPVLHG